MCSRGHPLRLFVQNDLSLFYQECPNVHLPFSIQREVCISLLSLIGRLDLVPLLAGHHPKELEPVLCQLLSGLRRRLSALQDLAVCTIDALLSFIISVWTVLIINYRAIR